MLQSWVNLTIEQPRNTIASAKIPQPRTEITQTSAKTVDLGKKIATLATLRKATKRTCAGTGCAISADATVRTYDN